MDELQVFKDRTILSSDMSEDLTKHGWNIIYS